MPHFAPRPRLAFAVDVHRGARDGEPTRRVVDLRANQIGHLNATSETGGLSEWPPGDCADVLLKLRHRRAVDRPVPGIVHARALLQTALGIIDKDMARKTWAAGEAFTMADCAAAPSLFYYNMVLTPLAGSFDNVAAYLDRLVKRPSYARALKEAEPFLKYVPM